MKTSYIIKDWMGNRVLPDQEFDGFYEAREAIEELASIEADNNFKQGTQDHEDLYNAICEDLYAEKVEA